MSPHHLILGGQRSGKSRHAERLAQAWLQRSPQHGVTVVATAMASDDEMRERIARHRRDRAERVPRMATVEEPLELARAIGSHSRADTLVVVDCLTLWLTALLMPAVPHPDGTPAARPTIAGAIAACAGPLVLISNEIGMGVIPMGRDARTFVDALGSLNQEAAGACERVTLMSAGLPMLLKGQP